MQLGIRLHDTMKLPFEERIADVHRLGFDTVQPSIATESNRATGAISPERLGVHSMERKTVSTISSSNLNAMPSL